MIGVSSKLKKLISVLALRDLFVLRALRFGVAASVEHRSIFPAIGPVDRVFDVGANRGQFALIARHCLPGAIIYSFEPLPNAAAVYRRIFAGLAKNHLIEAAVGSSAGTQAIHVSQRDDSSSLLPIGELQNAYFPGTKAKGVLNIRVGTIRDLFGEIPASGRSLLKIDVQGYELEVLKGCGPDLMNFNWIYCECSFVELYDSQPQAADVIEWLSAKGFKVDGVYNLTFSKGRRSIQADFLFKRVAPPH